MSVLQLRLKNCLQTILELQPAMRSFCCIAFAEDFLQLKSYLARVEQMELAEEEVARLEDMTSDFLREARFLACRSVVPSARLQ